MQNTPHLPYGQQTIEDDDLSAVQEALSNDFLTTGPLINKFEEEFSQVVGAKETVVCGNGTQALHLACLAADLEKGDCAIVPSITFLATANAVRYCGADVIFADVDPETGVMSPENFIKAINAARRRGVRVKAVLPVHLAGQTVDQNAIQQIAQDNNIMVVSDSCHALGTFYEGQSAGSCYYEDLATFSFHPVKTIAMGEGGAITTNSVEQAIKMRHLRSHGMVPRPEKPKIPAMAMDKDGTPNPWYYEMVEIGYNYRVTDIQCALGLSQLNKLDRFIKKRKELAQRYDELLKPLAPIVLSPKRVNKCDPAWHIYSVRVDYEALGISRAALMNVLRENGIGTQVHYIPVHTQPYYHRLYGDLDMPGCMQYYERTLSIPLYPRMNMEDADRVVQKLSEIIEAHI